MYIYIILVRLYFLTWKVYPLLMDCIFVGWFPPPPPQLAVKTSHGQFGLQI